LPSRSRGRGDYRRTNSGESQEPGPLQPVFLPASTSASLGTECFFLAGRPFRTGFRGGCDP
jgi:hypothetical protein